MSNLYNGSSEGFENLVTGYIDYAEEVITARAIPDLYDGLKPVHRRILTSAQGLKFNNGLLKSANLVGATLALHPHGDGSVYDAMVRMTESNASFNLPLFASSGELGRVHSSDVPAAMRYTKIMPNKNIGYFFRDMKVCKMKPAEEGDGLEPVVLPVRFPNILVNDMEGIAVSVRAKLPSFNLGDVIDLTVKYLESGELNDSDVIIPDFSTGGVLVKNNIELLKLMLTGKASLKIRAKVEINGKDILVKEVPAGKTVENITRAINNLGDKRIKSVMDASGHKSDHLLEINCKKANEVESVLLMLYKERILQNNIATNMIVIENGKPVILGVHGIIQHWVEWRKSVVTELFQAELRDVEAELNSLGYFIRLISNQEWKENYIGEITNKGKAEGRAYLESIFEDITTDVVEWISNRAISAFNNGGKYKTRYDGLMEFKQEREYYLAHPEEYIVKDLLEIKAEQTEQCKRKTFVTEQDYKFSKIVEAEIEDDSYCVYTIYKNGFMIKGRDIIEGKDVLASIPAQANSTLVGFDNFGRILRVYGTEIDFTPIGEKGVYLPKYFDTYVDGTDFEYYFMYFGLLDGSTRTLLYKDGYVGFLNTEELISKRKQRIIPNGVPVKVISDLVGVIEEKDTKEFILVADESTGKARFGLARVSDIPVRSRTSSAKVFSGNKINIRYYKSLDNVELWETFDNPLQYGTKMQKLQGRFIGDPSELIETENGEV